jgi:hypothetical protein
MMVGHSSPIALVVITPPAFGESPIVWMVLPGV